MTNLGDIVWFCDGTICKNCVKVATKDKDEEESK